MVYTLIDHKNDVKWSIKELIHALDACIELWIHAGSVVSTREALYLSVNIFSTKVLIGDTIFTSPTGDGIAVLRCHLSHAKGQQF